MDTENIIEEMDSIIAESLTGGHGTDSKTISIEILELAIRIEKLTKKHYAQISKRSGQKAARSMFDYLVAEELEHIKTLQTQYDALKGGNDWLKNEEYTNPLRNTCPTVNPSKEKINESDDILPKKGDIEPDATDLEALRLAIEVKKRAIKFYCNAAEKISDESGKKMFSHLIDIEEKHLKELEIQYMWLEQTGFWFDHTMVTD